MKKLLFLFVFPLLFFSSCEEDGNNATQIPFRPVYLEIDLNSVINKELWNINGHKSFPNNGYKGIIVHKESNNVFRAFEQACSFDPLEECAKVVIDDSNLFMIDKCCNSSFDFTGMPMGGPAFRNLLEYNTRIEGNLLIVENY